MNQPTKTLSRLISIAIFITCLNSFVYIVEYFVNGKAALVSTTGTLVLLGFNVFILLKIGQLRNWARRLFFILFILFSIPLSPAMLLSPQGGMVYSTSTLFASLERLFNLGDLLIGIVLIVHLFNPQVRALFVTTPPKTHQRVLLILLASIFLVGGIGSFIAMRKLGKYILVEGEEATFTEEGKRLFGRFIRERRQKEAPEAQDGSSPGVEGAVESKTVDALRKEADRLLGSGNVAARREIHVVYELVDRLLEAKQDKEALKYLLDALEVDPWRLDKQVACAKLLLSRGEETLAREKLKIVMEHAESDDLILDAASLLNKEVTTDISDAEKIPGENYVLVLVPMGETDLVLLNEVKDDLSKALNIPVELQKVSLQMPDAKRNRVLEEMRRHIKDSLKDPRVKSLFKMLQIESEDLDDNQTMEVNKELVALSYGDQAEAVLKEIDENIESSYQWDADELLPALIDAARPYKRLYAGYIGVTKKDMFAEESNFLFGWSAVGREYAVMSYHRFEADFNHEPPNRQRLKTRIMKQLLSSTSILYGIESCSNPTCPVTYPNDLAEHDAKSLNLCPLHTRQLKSAFENADPDSIEGLMRQVSISLYEKDYDAVIHTATLALDHPDAKREDVLHAIGDALWYKRDYVKAEEIYKELITLKPNSGWVKSTYAQVSLWNKKYDQAIEWAKKALEQEDHEKIHKILGDAYYRKGYNIYWVEKKYKEGGKYFELSVKHNARNAGAYYSLGDYYRSEERLQEAIVAYQEAIELNPQHPYAEQELKRTMEATGKRGLNQ